MPPKFNPQSFESLISEQEVVQAGKFQGRLLKEYNQYIFPGQAWREPCSSAVADFLRPFCVEDRVSLDGVIKGLCEVSDGNPVRWVEMGGGRALPMRQLANDTARSEHLVMTNVDLFDFGLEGLEPEELTYLERLSPGVTHELIAPNFIQADAETVVLPEPADLITSVEAVQYLNNPLAAISNWYNQLADNGLLLISAGHDWTSWIHYQRGSGDGDRDETPTKHFLEALEMAGISFAASNESDWEGGFRPKLNPDSFRNLVIQKTPGTRLVVNAPLTDVWVNPYHFKATYYEKPGLDSRPVIEVVAA